MLIVSLECLCNHSSLYKSLTICKFSPSGATAVSFAQFGQGTGPILLDDLQCSGSETRIINCPRYISQGIGTYDGCYNGHGEDAGVRCVQRK